MAKYVRYFGGKGFRREHVYHSKGEANQKASKQRQKGYLARVVKVDKGYALYVRYQ